MRRSTALMLAGLALLAVSAGFVASSSPDGLERVAEDLGFADRAAPPHAAPLPDYAVPGLSPGLSAPLAGLIGTLAVGGLAWGLGRGLTRARS